LRTASNPLFTLEDRGMQDASSFHLNDLFLTDYHFVVELRYDVTNCGSEEADYPHNF
jgi:hypothetical protein